MVYILVPPHHCLAGALVAALVTCLYAQSAGHIAGHMSLLVEMEQVLYSGGEVAWLLSSLVLH